jgi:hypothetical protein
MTGRRELFIDLDTLARGMVRFGDESKVEIHGVRSIVFEAKTGEHQVIHGIYYIPALCNSIMSLGQLDEGGSKVEIEDGVLSIWDWRCHLLVKVWHGANRLYILHLNTAKPPASSRARMMKHGVGMSATATSTSTPSTSSPRMTWRAAYRRSATSGSFATLASSPSTAELHSQSRPSTTSKSLSSSSMVISAAR